ncbi:MAG: ATP-binding cassette domain-containing protein [Planctomycetes bacterium]|nr:ATP-binding cassette domain-containing protein [Planctomycetota bacterium]MCB9918393.1 ATP-binding cassette domain-containing protein [Planctomycetota bacterium]
MRFLHRERPADPGTGDVEALIEVERVSTSFGDNVVLDGIDMTVGRGEIFVIIGPSGCGKTTLLRHMSGMLRPSSGVVRIGGESLYDLPEDELDSIRRRMGFSFQHGALLNSMSVIENVALPLAEAAPHLSRDLIVEVAQMKLEMVGLLDAKDRAPSDLSGGMKKRAAIARAIALDPELVFFDEPSAGLDPITAAAVDNLILKLARIFGITMVVVTHDIASAFTIGDRMALLFDGRVFAHGRPEDVQQHPDARVQDFIHRALPRDEARSVDITDYLAKGALR